MHYYIECKERSLCRMMDIKDSEGTFYKRPRSVIEMCSTCRMMLLRSKNPLKQATRDMDK